MILRVSYGSDKYCSSGNFFAIFQTEQKSNPPIWYNNMETGLEGKSEKMERTSQKGGYFESFVGLLW